MGDDGEVSPMEVAINAAATSVTPSTSAHQQRDEARSNVGNLDTLTAPVAYVAHVMMDQGVEHDSLSTAESVRAFALLAVTAVLWPLSLIPLLLTFGLPRTWVLLQNLGYAPTHSWDDARVRGPHFATGWWPLRVGVLSMHHGTTLLFMVAVALWAASPKPPAPTDADAWPAPSVTSAILAFQLLSTLASMLARRLSFATFVFGMMHVSHRPRWVMRQLTRGALSPLHTFHVMGEATLFTQGVRLKPTWLSTAARLGLPPDLTMLRVTAPAYRALYSAANTIGDSMAMVPIADTETVPREVRLPDGHVALAVVPPARFRSDFLRALSAVRKAALQPDLESGTAAAELDVEVDFAGWVDAQVLAQGSAARRSLFGVALGLIAVGLSVAVAPIAIRGGMLGSGYAFGSNAMEHASASLLFMCEVLIALAPTANGAMLTFFVYNASRTRSELLAHLIQPRQWNASGTPRAAHSQPSYVRSLSPSKATVSAQAPQAVSAGISWVPMDADCLTPLSALPLQHASRAPLERIELSDAQRDALQGVWMLDTVTATRSFANALLFVISNISTTGLAYAVGSVGSVSAVTSVLLSGALSVAFSVSPDLIASGGLGGSTNVTVLRHAAVVPTVCMLLSFLANCVVLLAAFREASLIMTQLRSMEASVLQAMAGAATVMSDRAAQRRQLLHELAAAKAHCNAEAIEARQHNLADVDGDLSELIALSDAHRVLLERVRALLRDAGGIRFLGMFRPGAASVGGLLALMTSATVLALRLVGAARGVGFIA